MRSNQVVSDELFVNVHWLLNAIVRGLDGHRSDTPEIENVLSRLSEQETGQNAMLRPGPRRLPACGLLPDAVGSALAVASDVAAAIAAIDEDLHWKQNPNYSDKAMDMRGYMDGYAYAEIIGPKGFFAGDDFLLGLMLLGPRRLYREHYHEAPELYWLLTGPSNWKQGAGGWATLSAGSTRWHRPLVVHATETADTPLLAIWAWTRDVAQAARLVAV
jgi:hypothetical protein